MVFQVNESPIKKGGVNGSCALGLWLIVFLPHKSFSPVNTEERLFHI